MTHILFICIEKWKRLHELKRRNEEFKETLKDIDIDDGVSGDGEKNVDNNGINKSSNNKKRKLKVEHIPSTSTTTTTSSPSSLNTCKNINIKNLPSISPTLPIPKSITKYINMNPQLKGTDHGRLAQKVSEAMFRMEFYTFTLKNSMPRLLI